MKKLFLVPFFLALSYTPIMAGQIACGPAKEAMANLTGPKYSETYGFAAISGGPRPARLILTVNPSTGTWTMLMVPNSETLCVLMTGTGFVPVDLLKFVGPPT